jgi:hypothetical protein
MPTNCYLDSSQVGLDLAPTFLVLSIGLAVCCLSRHGLSFLDAEVLAFEGGRQHKDFVGGVSLKPIATSPSGSLA